MKVVFLFPVYNDWDSLKILSQEIKNLSEKQKWKDAELLIVNDASTEEIQTSPNPFKIKSTILNLFSNQGSQKAIAIGLSYLNDKNIDFDFLIIMDADGEDKSPDVINLIDEAKKNKMKKILFASRAKRKQGLFFDFFYKVYKFIFKVLTGEKFDFGHFSCIHKSLLDKVVNVQDIWSHYSAGIKKSKIPIETIKCDRGQRIAGHTKTSKKKLFLHGLTSLSVYMETIVLNFFLASFVGVIFILFGLFAVFYLRFFTELSPAGWASNMIIGFTIILIILVLVCFLSLLNLLNKNSIIGLPLKNAYKQYIQDEIQIPVN